MLRAPRRNGAVVSVYSDGSLAYRFPPDPRVIRSQTRVLTPEQFIQRFLALGYTFEDEQWRLEL